MKGTFCHDKVAGTKLESGNRKVLSGTIHLSYGLGHKLSDSLIKKETEDLRVSNSKRKRQAPGKGRRTGSSTNKRTVTLKDLVESGILQPGSGVMSVAYKGSEGIGNLCGEGIIEFDGEKFQSATAFSIHFKRKITPSKQGDDGWKSVLYRGIGLDIYRKKFLESKINGSRTFTEVPCSPVLTGISITPNANGKTNLKLIGTKQGPSREMGKYSH